MVYRLSVSAELDLIGIYEDGAADYGIAQAEAYAADLTATLDLLATFPGVAAVAKAPRRETQ